MCYLNLESFIAENLGFTCINVDVHKFEQELIKKDTKPIAFIVEKNPAFLSSDPLWQLKIRVSQPLLHIFLNIPVKFVSCHECNVESLRCQFIICMKIAAELICTCYQTSGCFTGTGSYRSDTECDLRSS